MANLTNVSDCYKLPFHLLFSLSYELNFFLFLLVSELLVSFIEPNNVFLFEFLLEILFAKVKLSLLLQHILLEVCLKVKR